MHHRKPLLVGNYDFKAGIGEEIYLSLGHFHEVIAFLVIGFEYPWFERDEYFVTDVKIRVVHSNDHRVVCVAVAQAIFHYLLWAIISQGEAAR